MVNKIITGVYLNLKKLTSLLSKIYKLLGIFIYTTKKKYESGCVIKRTKIRGTVSIGERCVLRNSIVAGNVSIRDWTKIDDVKIHGNVEIGNNTSIYGPNTDVLSAINKVKIGKFCSIARNVSIQEYNHKMDRLTTYYYSMNIMNNATPAKDITSDGDIVIGNDVWIGAHSVILSGITIGDGAVIGANCVVTGDVPPYAVVGGVPARVIKYRFNEEIIEELLKLCWWNWSLEKIKLKSEIFLLDSITLEDVRKLSE